MHSRKCAILRDSLKKQNDLLKRYVKNLLLWDFLRIFSLPSIPGGRVDKRTFPAFSVTIFY